MSELDVLERKAILLYCTDLLKAMGQGQYKLILLEEPSPEESDASMHIDSGYLNAKLAIGTGWNDLTDERQAEALVHECFHVVVVPFDDILPVIHEGGNMGVGTMNMLNELMRQKIETACDTLTHMFCDYVDTEAWWKKSKRNAKKDQRAIIPIKRTQS